MADKFTEEELAGLTDDEREALLADDEDDGDDEGDGDDEDNEGEAGDGADGAVIDGELVDGGDGTGTDGDGDPSGKAEGDGDPAAGEQEEADGAAQRPAPAPILTAEDPGDVESRLNAFKEQRVELRRKRDDGEITYEEYDAQMDALDEQRQEFREKVIKADLARDLAEQQARNEWNKAVGVFLDAHPQYRQNELMHKTMDRLVRELGAQEENQQLSGAEILEKAHGMIVEGFGLQEAPKPKAGKDGGKPPARKPLEVPPTLGRLPASDQTETENTRWTKLDRLAEVDPERYEAELAKLSDAYRDTYLQAQ